jgi:aconitate hydratase A / 2-methylisocitrate dehydratase
VNPPDFNSYGARRGNHEVMVRGTFANIRLRNLLAPGTEGGWTLYQGPASNPEAFDALGAPAPCSELMTIYDASMRYQSAGIPLIVLAGKEYGSGSSRDWAAKGTLLLGVRAVIAESFERIHRSNLVNMGVLPLQFKEGESASALKLTGLEVYDIAVADLKPRATINVRVQPPQGSAYVIEAVVRIDTPEELTAFRHGGILPYVLRQLVDN